MAKRDRIALVTGASSGIGEAIAERLVAEGFTVVGCARRMNRLVALQEKLGNQFIAKPCDLRDADQIVSMFHDVQQEIGFVEVLINNAGLGKKAPLLSGSTEAWREVLDVNVLGLSICTREAVAHMMENGDRGYVIHISSMAGHRVPSGSGMYSASKFAVRSLTDGLRQELRSAGSHIRVSAISPGFVETEFAEVYSGSKKIASETYSRYKVLEARDIADQVAYLLSTPAHVQIHDILVRPTEQPN